MKKGAEIEKRQRMRGDKSGAIVEKIISQSLTVDIIWKPNRHEIGTNYT